MKHQQVLELAVRYLIVHREKALILKLQQAKINKTGGKNEELKKEIERVEKLRKELERDFAIL